jgi:hypothetical protein
MERILEEWACRENDWLTWSALMVGHRVGQRDFERD